jgi:hypothetical protein
MVGHRNQKESKDSTTPPFSHPQVAGSGGGGGGATRQVTVRTILTRSRTSADWFRETVERIHVSQGRRALDNPAWGPDRDLVIFYLLSLCVFLFFSFLSLSSLTVRQLTTRMTTGRYMYRS